MPMTRITLDLDHDMLKWYDDYAKAQKEAGRKISRNELVRKAMEYYRNKLMLEGFDKEGK